MIDRNFRSLAWSVLSYYAITILVLVVLYPPSRTDTTIFDSVLNVLAFPLLLVILFFGALWEDSTWIAWPIVIAVLAGLCAAVFRLRGKWRIAAVLTLLTVMNDYGIRVGNLVGA